MRPLRFGLLLGVGLLAGCSGGGFSEFFENYNGIPWPWLLNKSEAENPADVLIRRPQISPAQRFNKPADGSGPTEGDFGGPGTKATSSDSPVLGTVTPVEQSPAE